MTTAKRPPLPLTSDANTLACWPLSGVNPDPDIGPHGWSLTPAGSVLFPAAGSDLGVGWSIGADAISGLVSANNIAGTVEPFLIGEWTMELMVFLPPGQARWVLLFGGVQSAGNASQNMLGGIYASASATQTQFATGWQTTNPGWPFPGGTPLFTALLNDPAPNQWVHVLVRKKLNVDTVHYDASIWVNGVKQAELLAQPNAVGGTNASQRWGVGMWPDVANGPGTGGDGFVLVDRVKVHTVALSDSAIAQRFSDSSWVDVPPAAPPVLANLSPTAGAGIQPTAVIAFDALSDNTIMIVAEFPSLGIREVVHDGTSFLGAYASLSTRSPISGGQHFALLRQNGWPASPTFIAYSVE